MSCPFSGRSAEIMATTRSSGASPSSRRTSAPAPGAAGASIPLWTVTIWSSRAQPWLMYSRRALSDTAMIRVAHARTSRRLAFAPGPQLEAWIVLTAGTRSDRAASPPSMSEVPRWV